MLPVCKGSREFYPGSIEGNAEAGDVHVWHTFIMGGARNSHRNREKTSGGGEARGPTTKKSMTKPAIFGALT